MTLPTPKWVRDHPWGSEWEREVAVAVWRELGQIVRPEHFVGVVQGIAARLRSSITS